MPKPSIGDGYWFTECAVAYARERTVFDLPLSANQGIQVPLTRAPAPYQSDEDRRLAEATTSDSI